MRLSIYELLHQQTIYAGDAKRKLLISAGSGVCQVWRLEGREVALLYSRYLPEVKWGYSDTVLREECGLALKRYLQGIGENTTDA